MERVLPSGRRAAYVVGPFVIGSFDWYIVNDGAPWDGKWNHAADRADAMRAADAALDASRDGTWCVASTSGVEVLASGAAHVEVPVEAVDDALSDPIGRAKNQAEHAAREIGRAILIDLFDLGEGER